MRFLVAAAAAAALAAPAYGQQPQAAIARDFDAMATGICYRVVAGEMAIQSSDTAEEIRRVKALGPDYGIPGEIETQLGPGVRRMIDRATLASRASGDHRLLLAMGGSAPGCRVILAGAYRSGLAEAVLQQLAEPGSGWARVPSQSTRLARRVRPSGLTGPPQPNAARAVRAIARDRRRR